MRALRLNADSDLDTTNASLSLVSGRDAILQKLRIGLRTFQGEWFLDVRTGMPYYQNILIKNAKSTDVQNLFKQAILSCDGITNVVSISTDFDRTKRALTLSFVATTDDGSEIAVNDSFVLRAA